MSEGETRVVSLVGTPGDIDQSEVSAEAGQKLDEKIRAQYLLVWVQDLAPVRTIRKLLLHQLKWSQRCY